MEKESSINCRAWKRTPSNTNAVHRETKLSRVRPPKEFGRRVRERRHATERNYWVNVLHDKDLETRRAAKAKENFLDKFLLGGRGNEGGAAQSFAASFSRSSPHHTAHLEKYVKHWRLSVLQRNFFGKPIQMTKVLVLTSERLVCLRETKEGVDRVYGSFRSDKTYVVEQNVELRWVERIDLSIEALRLVIAIKPLTSNLRGKSQQQRKKKKKKLKTHSIFCGNLIVCKQLFQSFLVQLEATHRALNKTSETQVENDIAPPATHSPKSRKMI
eukprot:jgi/Bigna1/141838/aug1.65_g16546